MEGEPTERKIITGKYGTFDALGRSYLRSAAFAGLAAETQRTRRRLVESFASKYGNLSVAGLERRHVKTILDGFAATPGTARNMLSMLRVLIALAIEDGIRNDDLTAGIRRPKLSAVVGIHGLKTRSPPSRRNTPSALKPALPSRSRSTPGSEPPT